MNKAPIVKERGILFQAPLVLAILAGIKTLTRRMRGLERINIFPNTWANPQRLSDGISYELEYVGTDTMKPSGMTVKCPYGRVGDHLWVRETWGAQKQLNGIPPSALFTGGKPAIYYRADGKKPDRLDTWRPSIHMPRLASRILLEVVDIRLERLQSITEAEALAEGKHDGRECYYERGSLTYIYDDNRSILAFAPVTNARASFAMTINNINAPRTWERNVWVWVIVFKQIPMVFPSSN